MWVYRVCLVLYRSEDLSPLWRARVGLAYGRGIRSDFYNTAIDTHLLIEFVLERTLTSVLMQY